MSEFAACPKCGATSASKVGFTWWGGLLGPRLFSHVKCGQCGAGYNGKSGKSNDIAIAIYIGVSLLIAFAIFGVLCLGGLLAALSGAH